MNNNSQIEGVSVQRELSKFIDRLDFLEDYRLPQRAYHIIRLAIRDLILEPGKTFLEREMSEILKMSRTPVREALVRLETEGLVRLIPRRGFIVSPIESEDLKEIYRIVETLDGLAIEIATNMVTDKDIDQLEKIISKQEEVLQHGDYKRWAILDDQFHALIINYANNKRLSAVIDSHSDQTYRARLYTINTRPIPLRSIVEHKGIIACMKAQDEKAARTIMESHRRRAQKEILLSLEEIKLNDK